jgi:mRNA interferase MazF
LRPGDLVTVAVAGAYRRPRQTVVVQSNLFEAHTSATILQVTSALRDAPIFCTTVHRTPDNGLGGPTQIMVDKAQDIPRAKVGAVFMGGRFQV